MSDQHHGMVQELDEQKQLDDQHTSVMVIGETQISYWALLETVPSPGWTPESGDKVMLEEAGAERISQIQGHT